MTTEFKVGDRVRIKAEYGAFAKQWGLTGDLVFAGTSRNGRHATFNGTTRVAAIEALEHVPAPAPIDPAKKYRTRDGREVRIYATDGGGSTEVHGAIKGGDGWGTPQYWRANGQYFTASESEADLVEVKPERSGWVNVYDGSDKGYGTSIEFIARRFFETKQEADASAASYPDWSRIACLHLTFREGDGLEGK